MKQNVCFFSFVFFHVYISCLIHKTGESNEDTEIIYIPSAKARFVNWLSETKAHLIEKLRFVIRPHSRWHWLVNGNCFLIALTFITTTYMVSLGAKMTSMRYYLNVLTS